MKNCANEECGKLYEPKVHNSKYCSNECCLTAAKTKVSAEKPGAQSGKRRCECGTILSRYNDSNQCHPCQARSENELLRMLEVMEDGGS